MKDLFISGSDNDLVITDYDLSLVDEADRVRQQIHLRLGTFKGEWFLDESFGVPYMQEIFKKRKDFGYISSLLKTLILGVPEVTSIYSFDMSYNDQSRVLAVTFAVNSAYGVIDTQEVF